MAVYNKLEENGGRNIWGKDWKIGVWKNCGSCFPYFLCRIKKWAGWYREEKGRLEVLLGAGRIKRVSHIGSTAVSGIWAKNIIDILLEVPDKKRMAEVREILKNNGWLCMNTSKNRISGYRTFCVDFNTDEVRHCLASSVFYPFPKKIKGGQNELVKNPKMIAMTALIRVISF